MHKATEDRSLAILGTCFPAASILCYIGKEPGEIPALQSQLSFVLCGLNPSFYEKTIEFEIWYSKESVEQLVMFKELQTLSWDFFFFHENLYFFYTKLLMNFQTTKQKQRNKQKLCTY